MTRIALVALLLFTAAAQAEEKPITLKDGPGRDVVEGNCAACHTLDYIGTNSVFMDRQVWTAEVNKMIGPFGAPIAPEDANKIIDYLAKNYGK
jgi:sulfite dehydrogenase (cytochrome) subunit B